MFDSDRLIGRRDFCARTCEAPDEVEYGGALYTRHADDRRNTTKYYSRRDGDKVRFLHRDMFQEHRRGWKGKDWTIPGGMHVHHANGDALTNYTKNFDMVTEDEHNAIHVAGILAIEHPNTVGQQYVCETCPRRIRRQTPVPSVHPDDTRQHRRRPRELLLKEATPANVRFLEEHGVAWASRPTRLHGGVERFTTMQVEMADRVRTLFPDMLM